MLAISRLIVRNTWYIILNEFFLTDLFPLTTSPASREPFLCSCSTPLSLRATLVGKRAIKRQSIAANFIIGLASLGGTYGASPRGH